MKRLSKIGLLILMLIPMFYFTACKSKVVSINVDNMKLEFAYGEDFEIGDDFTLVLVNKNNKTETLNLSDFEIKDTIMTNSEISIDFSAYKKNQIGEYDIIVTHLKSEKTTTYKVSVVPNHFEDSDYTVTNYRGVYDGKFHTISVTENVGANIKYGYAQGVYTLSEPIKFKNAGTFHVYYKIEKNGYEPPVEGDGIVEISPAPLTVTPKSVTIKYNQNFAHQGCDYDGFIEGESINDYPRRGTPEYTTNYLKGYDVGNYEIYIKGMSISNYSIEYKVGTLQVIKAENVLRVDINNITYGSVFNPIVKNDAEAETEYKVMYSPVGENDWHEGYPKTIGEYTIQFTTPATKNYESGLFNVDVTVNKKELIITPNDVTIPYGEEFRPNGEDYKSFVNDEGVEVLGGHLVYTTDYTVGDDVGDYHITIEGYTSENYNIVYAEAKLTVEKANNVLVIEIPNTTYGTPLAPEIKENRANAELDYYYMDGTLKINGYPKAVGTYNIIVDSLETDNYKKSSIEIKDVVISKKALTIKPVDIEIAYGNPIISVSYEYDGFEYNENDSVLGGDQTNYTTTYVYRSTENGLECSDVGVYTLTGAVRESNNYEISYVDGTVTVRQATRTFDVELLDTIYGTDLKLSRTEFIQKDNGADPVITYLYRNAGTEEEYTQSTTMPKNVGEYDIIAILSATKNYVEDSRSFQNVKVMKRTINVTPNEATINYLDSEDDIVYQGVTYTSNSDAKAFAYEEDETIFTGTLVYSTNYHQGDDAGIRKYDITVTGLTADNYDIVYKDGKLTVNKIENELVINVTPVTYTGRTPEPEIVSNPSGEAVKFEYLPTNLDGEIEENWLSYPTGVGSYKLRVSTPANMNYLAVEKLLDDVLVINKKDLTITAHSVTITYNEVYTGNDPAKDVDFEGFVESENRYNLGGGLQTEIVNFTVGSDVGEYDIVIGGYTSDNYNIIFINGKLTVVQSENNLEITFSNRIVYGESAEPDEGGIGNPSNGELTYSYKPQGEEVEWIDGLPINAGKYDVKVESAETKNYKSAVVEKTIEILVAEITITPNSVEIKCGEEFAVNPEDPVTISGYKYDDDASIFTGTLVYTTNYEVGDKADEYEIYVEGYKTANYHITYGIGILRVSKADNTLKVTIYDVTYGEALNVVLTEQNSDAPVEIEYVDTERGLTYKNGTYPTDVGTYLVTVRQQENDSYLGIGNQYTQIEKHIYERTIEIEWGELEFVYDGEAHYPTYTVGNLAYNDDCILSTNEGYPETMDAKESGYTAIVYSIINRDNTINANYKLPENRSVVYKITRQEVTEIPVIQSKVYTGKAIKPDITIPEKYVGIYNAELMVYDPSTGEPEEFKVQEVGIYKVKFVISNLNYKFEGETPDFINVNFEVTKANDNVILTESVVSENYRPEGDYNKINIESKYGIVVVTYKIAGEDDSTYTITRPTNAGNYIIYASVPESTNFNACEKTYEYTISKIDPIVPEIDTVVVSAGSHDLDKDQFVWSKLSDINLPTVTNGIFNWKNPDYTITNADVVSVEVNKVATFEPFDKVNYNDYDINVTVHIVDTITLSFDASEIIVDDVTEFYTGYEIAVIPTITGKAQDAKITYTTKVNEANPLYSDGIPAFTNVGSYQFRLRVQKIEEIEYENIEHKLVGDEYQEVVVKYTYSRYYNTYTTDIITVTINDYINFVSWQPINTKLAIIQNSQLDLSQYNVDITYASGVSGVMSISEFTVGEFDVNTETVVALDSSEEGEHYIAFEKEGRIYYDVTSVYVYIPFVNGFKFKYDETEFVSTTQSSATEFNATFTGVEQLYYYDETQYLDIDGINTYGANFSFDPTTVIELNEGTVQNVVHINMVINQTFVDVYTVTMTSIIESFDVGIDSLSAVYSAEDDMYIIENVVSKDYNSIGLGGANVPIVAIYNPTEVIFTDSTNLLATEKYSNNLTKVMFSELSESIIEFKANYMMFRLHIRVTVRELPIQTVEINGIDYTIDNSNVTIEARVPINASVLVDFGTIENCFIYMNYADGYWLDENNPYTSIDSLVTQEGMTYEFYVYTAKNLDSTRIQTIGVHFILENHIESFTIQTLDTIDTENPHKIYDVTHLSSLRVVSGEYVTGLTIVMEDTYTYDIYVNGELVTNIEDIVFTSSSTSTNNIAIVTYDASNEVVTYTYFTLELEFYHGGIVYSHTGELTSIASGITLEEKSVLYVDEADKVFYFDYSGNNPEETAVLMVNGIVTNLADRVELRTGINVITLEVYVNKVLQAEYESYIYVLEDEEFIFTSQKATTYANYSVYYNNEKIINSIVNKDITYRVDTYNIDVANITIRDGSNVAMSRDNYNIELSGRFIIITITDGEDQLVTVVRLMLNDVDFGELYGHLIYTVENGDIAILEDDVTVYISQEDLDEMNIAFTYQMTRLDVTCIASLEVNGIEYQFETEYVEIDGEQTLRVIPLNVTLQAGLNKINIIAIINDSIVARQESYIYVYADEMNVSSSEYAGEYLAYILYVNGDYATNISGYNLKLYVDNLNDIDTNNMEVRYYFDEENNGVLNVEITRENDILYLRWTHYDAVNNIYVNLVNTVRLIVNYSDFSDNYGTVVYSINDALTYTTELKDAESLEYKTIRYLTPENNTIYIDYTANDKSLPYTVRLYVNGVEKQLRTSVTLTPGINTISMYVTVQGAMTVKYEGSLYLLQADEENVSSSEYKQQYAKYNIYYDDRTIFYDLTVEGKNYYVDSYDIDLTKLVVKSNMLINNQPDVLNLTSTRVGSVVYLRWSHYDVTQDKTVILVNTIKLNLNNAVIDNNTDSTIYHFDLNNNATEVVFDSNNKATVKVYQGDAFTIILANKYATVEIEVENEVQGENVGGNYVYVRDEDGITKDIRFTVISSDGTASETYTITIEIEKLAALTMVNTKPDTTEQVFNIYSKDYELTGASFTEIMAMGGQYELGIITDSLSNYVMYDADGNVHSGSGEKYVKVRLSSPFTDFGVYKNINLANMELLTALDSSQDILLELWKDEDYGYHYYYYYVTLNYMLIKIEVRMISETTLPTIDFTFNYTVDENGVQTNKTKNYQVKVFNDKLFGEYFMMGSSYIDPSMNASTGTFAGDSTVYYVLYGYAVYSDMACTVHIADLEPGTNGKYKIAYAYKEGYARGTEFTFNKIEHTIQSIVVDDKYLMDYENSTVNVGIDITVPNHETYTVEKMSISITGAITTETIDDITNYDADILRTEYESYICLKITIGSNEYYAIMLFRVMD